MGTIFTLSHCPSEYLTVLVYWGNDRCKHTSSFLEWSKVFIKLLLAGISCSRGVIAAVYHVQDENRTAQRFKLSVAMQWLSCSFMCLLCSYALPNWGPGLNYHLSSQSVSVAKQYVSCIVVSRTDSLNSFKIMIYYSQLNKCLMSDCNFITLHSVTAWAIFSKCMQVPVSMAVHGFISVSKTPSTCISSNSCLCCPWNIFHSHTVIAGCGLCSSWNYQVVHNY